MGYLSFGSVFAEYLLTYFVPWFLLLYILSNRMLHFSAIFYKNFYDITFSSCF